MTSQDVDPDDAMKTADKNDNFSQVELDKFNALANRWWGETARSRATGSRAVERPRMDARAGALRHGWFEVRGIL